MTVRTILVLGDRPKTGGVGFHPAGQVGNLSHRDAAGHLLAGLLACLLALAGCAAPQAQVEQPDQVRQAPATQPAKRGGVFQFAVAGNNAHLNPYNFTGGAANLANAIYERLVARDTGPGKNWYEDQKMVPWLAERWEQPEQNTYVFHLRRGVTWHDGQPFTAADVVHSITHLKENRGRLNDSSYTTQIERVEAPDEYTVKMTLGSVNPDFLSDLYNIEITAKHVAAAGKALENTAIATGPFMLKDFDTTSGFKATRNPNYWMKDLPYLDAVAGFYTPDRSTVIAGFAAGNFDTMNAEDKVQFETTQSLKPGLTYERFYGQYSYGLLFPLDAPPFNDIRVRRAINLTADRQDMIVKAAFGEGVVNPPGVYGWKKGFAIPLEELLKLPGYNPATKQQDIAEAKRLLAEAGYPSGFSAKVSYQGSSINPKPQGEVLASQLLVLGINLTLVPLDNASYAQAIRDDNFELGVVGVRDSRSEVHARFHSKGVFNKRGPRDAELDALLDKYLVEFDLPAAQRLAQQWQRRLYDQSYFIGHFERSSYTLYQPWVHDVLNNYGAAIQPYWWPPITWMDVDQMPGNRRIG